MIFTNRAKMAVIDEIAAERRRQIEQEGWTPEHDDDQWDGSLASAAASYAWLASLRDDDRRFQIKAQGSARNGVFSVINALWPVSWSDQWFKPKDRRRDLIRAAALIVAEIERLDRATPSKGGRHG